MSIIGSGHALLLASQAAAAPVTGISRSLRFSSADSAFLSRTPASAGNRKTWTWSGWVKLGKLSNWGALFKAGSATSNPTTQLYLYSDNTLEYITYSGSTQSVLTTAQVFRDPSAWYHILLAVNTTLATADNRQRLYVNGIEITAFASRTNHSQNYDTFVNDNTYAHELGRTTNIGGSSEKYFDGYLADVYLIDGQALDPTSFGEFDTNGVWNPIAYTGSHGTNGFNLKFGDNSGTSSTTLGKDAAGSNNWTPNNFSVASGSGNDSLVDVPRNGDETDTGVGGEVRGNYCTLNPLAKGPNTTLSNGNLEQTTTSSGGCVLGTFGMSSGKWYWEALNGTSGNNGGYGIALSDIDLSGYPGQQANAWSYLYTGDKYNNGSGTSYGSTFTAGDIIGVAFDADNGTLTFYKNGVSQGTAFTGLTSGPYLPLMGAAPSYSAANFGQRAFAYTAPSGFKALCTTNLTTPTIADGSTAMDVKLYTGNGSTQTISGLGFSPDFVWLKKRSGIADHYLYDTVRGATYRLYSNTTDAESTSSTGLTAFTSTGFDLGSANDVNQSSNTYAAWTWDAGSSTVTNTSGSISSQVRANASAGFSIVTYTGTGSAATVGHGLGVAPQMVIVKSRSNVMDWGVYHISTGNAAYLKLNTTGSTQGFNAWNSTSPTSTVFSIGNIGETNTNTYTYVAYCFAPVAGYSAFGSYTGNGSTDGPFVYTGFRPRWLMIKNTTKSTQSWLIRDAVRDTYNSTTSAKLAANLSDSENGTNVGTASQTIADFLSNGFKVRTAGGPDNDSGDVYVWAAFAESPFQYARAR